ncbi:nuclear transport factor 2 family protein [Novosphingobium sp. JCM 18896]|uniref:nuclear transport factor 2 family protein n=1 Tax=Novosphingobium sp. JCM 18896 TaxID=2989731 RepID=UPI0022227DF5|nr:nuclear transport factor 2 family protein [Novosphingobium sp. JCM 18896]MCW1431057.1 nuclear transport factor 2 family protein [Novosphingobium sp. JCM 18896]
MPVAAIPLEDRLAIEDLAVAYCTAVDRIGDVDGVATLFTEGGVYDLAELGLGHFEGRAAIRGFFAGAFPTMAHNAHFLSNFALVDYAADGATAQAYVHGYSRGTDGSDLEVKARYTFDVVRETESWKIARVGVKMLIPTG